MAADIFTITILPDGTLKTATDRISPANHQSAEAFLRDLARVAGGETTREHRHGAAHHHHGLESEHDTETQHKH